MRPFGPFPLLANTPQTITLDLSPVVDTLILKNCSPYTLNAQTFQGGLVQVMPFWAIEAPTLDFQGRLDVLPVVDLQTSGNLPISSLYVDAYERGEEVIGQYPAQLPYMVTIGNTVVTTGGGVLAEATNDFGAGLAINDALFHNLLSVTFTAPSSGKVKVTALLYQGSFDVSTGVHTPTGVHDIWGFYLVVKEGASVVWPRNANAGNPQVNASYTNNASPATITDIVSVAPGSHTFTLAVQLNQPDAQTGTIYGATLMIEAV